MDTNRHDRAAWLESVRFFYDHERARTDRLQALERAIDLADALRLAMASRFGCEPAESAEHPIMVGHPQRGADPHVARIERAMHTIRDSLAAEGVHVEMIFRTETVRKTSAERVETCDTWDVFWRSDPKGLLRRTTVAVPPGTEFLDGVALAIRQTARDAHGAR